MVIFSVLRPAASSITLVVLALKHESAKGVEVFFGEFFDRFWQVAVEFSGNQLKVFRRQRADQEEALQNVVNVGSNPPSFRDAVLQVDFFVVQFHQHLLVGLLAGRSVSRIETVSAVACEKDGAKPGNPEGVCNGVRKCRRFVEAKNQETQENKE